MSSFSGDIFYIIIYYITDISNFMENDTFFHQQLSTAFWR